MRNTCNDCKRALCCLKMAVKKNWIIGEERGYKTAEQVIEECGLVCDCYSSTRVV